MFYDDLFMRLFSNSTTNDDAAHIGRKIVVINFSYATPSYGFDRKNLILDLNRTNVPTLHHEKAQRNGTITQSSNKTKKKCTITSTEIIYPHQFHRLTLWKDVAL